MPICMGPACQRRGAGLAGGTVYQAARVADGSGERVCRAKKAQVCILSESRSPRRDRINRLRIDG